MTFYSALYDDYDYHYYEIQIFYFKKFESAEEFVKQKVEDYRNNFDASNKGKGWKPNIGAADNCAECAIDCQRVIERYSDQLKSLDPLNDADKRKIEQLKEKIESKKEERNYWQTKKNCYEYFEFFKIQKIEEYKSKWIISEEEFVDK